jgi:hypothetical protein
MHLNIFLRFEKYISYFSTVSIVGMGASKRISEYIQLSKRN